jgi:hypothetical protein
MDASNQKNMKTLITSPLILIASAFVAFGAPTVVDSVFNPANNHLYYLLSTSDWLPAEAAAVTLGGHLATINNQAENDFLYNKWGQTRTLMIGLTDAAHEGTFSWTSGEPFTFSNWNSGEPNDGVGYGKTPENYTEMYANGFGTPGKWNDFGGVGPIPPEPNLQGVVEVVPEPSVCGLLLLGGLAAGYLRRRR